MRVPIWVREYAGIPRIAEPVTTGVPLPAGRVPGNAALWIADSQGRAVPSQSRVLERWPDGSARWVLVDFLATTGARQTATYSARDGRPPAAPNGPLVCATADPDGHRLTTGPLSLSVPNDGSALAKDVLLDDGARASVAVPTLAADGGTSAAVPGARVTVETEGPVRTELLLRGRYADDLAWEARVAAFAGSPVLRVQLTLTSLANRTYTRIRSVRLPVTAADPTSGFLGVGGASRKVALDGTHAIEQLDFRSARLDGKASDASGDGWARVAGDRMVVTAVRRWFAEEWPQALDVSKAGLGVDLLAGKDETVDLGVGAAKTFELWLVFQSPRTASDPFELAAQFQRPLVTGVDAAWTAASHALPKSLAPTGPGVRALLPRLDTAIGRYLARNRAERWDDGPPVDCDARTSEHERIGAYGALNWGDWNFPGYRDKSEGCDAWGNLEYDLTQVLGLDFAVTGSRTTWDAFVAAARHYRDVDVVHYAPGHEDWVGINHPHKVKHFAVESQNKIDLGHTWLEGLVTHYRLTGEVRSIEAARGIADAIVLHQSKAGNPRQFGWPMIALVAAADATGDARYRDSASAFADKAVTVHDPTPAFGDWRMGILADGIAGVHALTHEQRLRDWLVKYADAFVADPAKWDDPRYALPLGYLTQLTGSTRYREAGLAVVDAMPIGDWGKTLAISGRTAFRILSGFGPGAAATPARAAPPPPSAPARKPPSRSQRAPARRSAN